MRARAALVCAVLAIVAGMAIAGVKIARADGGGACIYNAIVAPIAGYPSLPACDTNRNLDVQLRNGANVAQMAGNTNDAAGALTSIASASFNFGYNGTSWDRLRTVGGVNGVFTNKILAIGACDGAGGACANVTTYGSSDAIGAGASQLAAAAFRFGFNGTTWDRMRTRLGEQQTTDGGNTRNTLNAGTTCTSIIAFPTTLHGAWASSSTETVTTTFYDEGASPTCAAADKIWSGVLSPTTKLPADIIFGTGLAYVQSGTPVVLDFVQTR